VSEDCSRGRKSEGGPDPDQRDRILVISPADRKRKERKTLSGPIGGGAGSPREKKPKTHSFGVGRRGATLSFLAPRYIKEKKEGGGEIFKVREGGETAEDVGGRKKKGVRYHGISEKKLVNLI